ncbi:MAG: hypothetical protein ACI81R_001871 [Bradymonadia bacterium]|jgi:hypothetical protein
MRKGSATLAVLFCSLTACNAASTAPEPPDLTEDVARSDAMPDDASVDAAVDVDLDSGADLDADTQDPCINPEIWPVNNTPCNCEGRSVERDFEYRDDAGVFLGECPQRAECLYSTELGDVWRIYEFCEQDAG